MGHFATAEMMDARSHTSRKRGALCTEKKPISSNVQRIWVQNGRKHLLIQKGSASFFDKLAVEEFGESSQFLRL